MSLIDVHSAATAGIADALIAVEVTRTAILLMIELHRASWYEESYSCASLSSIARESFRVRLWLRQINFGLERTTAMTSSRSTTAPPRADGAPHSVDSRRCPLHFYGRGDEWSGMHPGRAEISPINPKKLVVSPARTLCKSDCNGVGYVYPGQGRRRRHSVWLWMSRAKQRGYPRACSKNGLDLGASPVPLESHACGAQGAPQAWYPAEVQFPGGIDSMPLLYRDLGSSSQESIATMEGNHATQPRNAPEKARLSRMPRYFFHLGGDLPPHDLMGVREDART
jgi:hypothetical protein